MTNLYQPGYLILWNPREHVNSFRSSKLTPKLLGPYSVISQERNDIICTHCHLKTYHTFHSDPVSPFLGAPTDAAKMDLLDKKEYVVSAVLHHRGNLNRLKTVEVLVSWLGYGAESNTCHGRQCVMFLPSTLTCSCRTLPNSSPLLTGNSYIMVSFYVFL